MEKRFDYFVDYPEDSITITSIDDEFPDFSISLSRFWNWAKSNNLNQYCEDYYDASEDDGHGQRTGEYTMKEYFDNFHAMAKDDIHGYLIATKNKKYL